MPVSPFGGLRVLRVLGPEPAYLGDRTAGCGPPIFCVRNSACVLELVCYTSPVMAQEVLSIRGARQHNLKNIDLDLPRDRLIVFTGLSGSGKSSLAFDTIFAEGQRRYVESLSAYARQFLGQMDKPDVDQIDGLSPAISIDQKSTSRNPRSTVGTVTEIHDYLRLLFARIGHPHCPNPRCSNFGGEISRQTVEQIVDTVLSYEPGSRIMVMAPVARGRKGEYRQVFDDARRNGFVRARVDGTVYDLGDDIVLEKYKKHDIEIVVDRLRIEGPRGEQQDDRARLADSVETALKMGGGLVIVAIVDGPEQLFSENYACPVCGTSVPEIEPRTFSFNSPHGACPECTGLGSKMVLDPDLIIPNPHLSIAEGAVQPWARSGTSSPYYLSLLEGVAERYGFSPKAPIETLTQEQIDKILHGSGDDVITVRRKGHRGMQVHFEGVIPNLMRRYGDTESEWMRGEIEQYMSSVPCPSCRGARLKPESLAVTTGG